MNDRPVHLQSLTICKKDPNAEASVTVPVWITQSSLDGLYAIMKVLEGMEKGGNGQISGSFELTMFYRTLCNSIGTAETSARAAAKALEK